MDKRRIIVCIPAYNEQDTIGGIIEASQLYSDIVVVIDDGSRDNTAEVALKSGGIVIKNGRNIGKGAALKRGLSKCLDYAPFAVVTLDADGQHDPHDIPALLAPIESGNADIVVGSRFGGQSVVEVPFVRGLGLALIGKMSRSLFRSSVKDSQSGFRAYSGTVLGNIMEYSSNGYGAETEQLATAEFYGYRITEVSVHIRYKGLKNTSKRSKVSHGAEILSTILRMAVERRPLLLFGLSGFIFIIVAAVTLSHLVTLFNDTRYFSLPLAMITIGFSMLGALLIFASLVLYAIKRIVNHNIRTYPTDRQGISDFKL